MSDRVLMYHPKLGKDRALSFRKGRQANAWAAQGWKPVPSKKRTKPKEEAE